MRKFFAVLLALGFTGVAVAQELCVLTGFPVPRRSPEAIEGALVTMTSEWDKDLNYKRRVGADGFRMVVPKGGYLLTIEAEGYETYVMEIEMDQTSTDLGLMRMLTTAEATAKAEKQRARAKRY
ncbi:MAG: carboxypeptidase regulatory-like domain-containing protein [Alistipes sp.]|nr:carboxypeptidase regulatory-like domain-containing protein [Alistipes sp.]